MTRPTIRTTVGLAVLSAPLAASAQTGSITTSPFAEAAPALGAAMLAVLVVCLSIAAAFSLRPTHLRNSLKLASLFAPALLVGIGYAGVPSSTIELAGPECFEVTTHSFNGSQDQTIVNQCPNPQHVDSVVVSDFSESRCEAVSATADEGLAPLCEAELVLQPGDRCRIPANQC